MKKILAILAAVGLMAAAGTAMAADSTDLLVEAEVLAACSVETVDNIDFGDLDPINDPATTTASTAPTGSAGSVRVTCTNLTSYSLGATPASPTMTLNGGGTNPIAYTPVFTAGPFTAGTSADIRTIDATVAKTAYETAPAGAYSGQLTITVSY
ncbi:MAG TPA: spore coat protein U domain-containing protein [Geobacteraceae bacterium]|nr:spore coat protein U domain-containing protein [Geobacteraceae bacterium]